MQAHTLLYDLTTRAWSAPRPPRDAPRTHVLAFGAPEVRDTPEVLSEVRKRYPNAHMIGCSSAGEIAGGQVLDGTLTLAVARFERTALKTARERINGPEDSFEAGRRLAAQLARADLAAAFVLAEGLQIDGSALIRGFNSALAPGVVVTGGLAADGARFGKTWVCIGDELTQHTVTAIGFYGQGIRLTHGSQAGWDEFGPQRQITRAQGSTLFELDGKPALALYKTYLAEKAQDLPASGLLFPLAVRTQRQDERFLIRTLLSVDDAQNSLTFAGEIPQGAWAQLMKANLTRLIDSADGATFQAIGPGAEGAGEETLAIAVSCVGRRLVLGERAEEEVEAVLANLPPTSHLVGFYSYGELAPYAAGERCELHNQTMTLTVIREERIPRPRETAPVPPAAVMRPSNVNSTLRGLSRSVAGSSSSGALLSSAARASSTSRRAIRDPKLRIRSTHIAKVQGSLGNAPLHIEQSEAGGVRVVSLQGRMSETFRGAQLGRELSGVVVLDLARVERVTSYGVREWLQMLSEAESRVDALFLARCSEAVSNQLSMIRAFAGSGQIVSFYAPYQCEQCACLFGALLDCEEDHPALIQGQPPIVTCPQCLQETQSLDDDPASCFAFVPRAPLTLPPFVRRALQALPEPDAGEPVEKTLDGDTTCIRINSALDPTLRWSRILDGVEGDVRLDLGGVTQSTPNGVADLAQALQRLPHQVRLRIQGCPEPVAFALGANPRETVRVDNLIIQGRCARCGAEAPVFVDLEREGNAVIQGRLPSSPCRRCEDGVIGVLHAREMLEALALGAVPLPVEAIIPPAGTAPALPVALPPAPEPLPTPPPAPVPLPAPAPLPAPIAVPQVVVTQAPPQRVPAWAWGVVLLLGVAIVGLGVMLVQRETERQPLTMPLASATAPSTPTPASAPPEPRVEPWDTPNGLPPAWTEHPVTLEDQRVLLVGHASAAPSPDEGLSQARTDALARLIEALYRELRGKPTFALWRARLGERLVADAEAVERLTQQLGADLQLERAESQVRSTPDGAEVYVLYALPRDAFNAALDSYSATLDFRGITFARAFPAWSADLRKGDLVVINANEDLQALGARPGGILQSVDGEPVYTLSELDERLKERWRALRWGQSLKLVIESEGVPQSVLLERRGRR